MNLTKITENLNNVSSLPDYPTLQSAELKAVFDKAGNTLKDFINNTLIPEIEKQVTETVTQGIKVESTLTSSSDVNALSASQGLALKNMIDELGKTDTKLNTRINNLIKQDQSTEVKINKLSERIEALEKGGN